MNKMKMLIVAITMLMVGSLAAQNVLDGVYIKEHMPKRRAVPYTHLREADVAWTKRYWRVLDLREKINHPLYFPTAPIQDRKSLWDVIKAGVNAGSLIAYSKIDDEFKIPLTKSEVEAMLSRTDTVQIESIDNPGTYEQKISKTDIESQDIKQVRVKEDWFFDKQKSVLEARVIGICPMKESKDENGEVRGMEGMFWIYFPEARPLFAVSEVYNRENDGERRTMDDIFWKRQFGSYIYKESNVYDRKISEYKAGLDALLEAERIKEGIWVLEHDLWHF